MAAGWGLTLIARAYASNSWVSTQGQIIRSNVITHRARGGPNNNAPSFSADVAYRYSVAGVVHTSDRIKFGMGSTSARSNAEFWVNRYRAGTTTTVYHDPDNPAQAVLERGISITTMFPLGVGLLFSVVGLSLLTWRLRHSPSPQVAQSDLQAS